MSHQGNASDVACRPQEAAMEEVEFRSIMVVISSLHNGKGFLNALRGHSCGRAGIRRALVELLTVLLDLHVLADQLRHELPPCSRMHETLSGTASVTGAPVTETAAHIFRIHGGQIVEE